MQSGDVAIYRSDDADKTKPGKYILDMVQFSTPGWVSDANFDLLSDFEHQRLTFPAELEYSDKDERYNQEVDNLYLELEAMKEELCQIVTSQTTTGILHFGLPSNAPRRARKDRYSSLLLAASAARDYFDKMENTTDLPAGNWA
jgi:hypothetical protein